MAGKESVTIPHSKTKMAILQVMKERNFIQDFTKDESGKFPGIDVELNNERRDITLKRISKPGQRIYMKSQAINKVNGGLGVAIISTPKGIMSGEQAKKEKVGGEIICELY